jgi:DNA-binding XRE family transcriptional regulator
MEAVQSKMARVALDLTVKQLAKLSGVSHDTINRLEAG